jgi:FkbM family methyltransferase
MWTTGDLLNTLIRLYLKLFAKARFRQFHKALFIVGARGLGLLNFENDVMSGERHLIRNVLPRHVKSSHPVFVDVGGHIGNYTQWLLDQYPDANVHVFEPHPYSFARLANRDWSGRVVCHNSALSRAPGAPVALFDRDDGTGSHHATLYPEVIDEIYHRSPTRIMVEVDSLDHVAAAEGIARIDLLKIDTEGHELAVLCGARRLLSEGRIGLIHFEFNEMNVFSRSFFRDFRAILRGYEFFRLLPGDLLPVGSSPLQTELFAFQNILAVPREAVPEVTRQGALAKA